MDGHVTPAGTSVLDELRLSPDRPLTTAPPGLELVRPRPEPRIRAL